MYKQLTQILAAARLIARPQGASTTELQEDAGISRSTVNRLIKTLENFGFPVYSEPDGHKVRFKLVNLDNTFKWWLPIQKPSLSMSDRDLLRFLFAGADLPSALDEPLEHLRERIGPYIADGGISIIESDTLNEPNSTRALHSRPKTARILSEEAKKWVDILIRSIHEHAVCIVTYKAMNTGKTSRYKIHPLALFERDEGIYVYVEVPHYGKVITLAVERITKLDLTEEEFTPPADFNAEARLADPFGIVHGEPITAKIRFSAERAKYVREKNWPAGTVLQDTDDGGLLFTITTNGAFDLKRWVLAAGEGAELIEPEGLRGEIKEELERALRNYLI